MWQAVVFWALLYLMGSFVLVVAPAPLERKLACLWRKLLPCLAFSALAATIGFFASGRVGLIGGGLLALFTTCWLAIVFASEGKTLQS